MKYTDCFIIPCAIFLIASGGKIHAANMQPPVSNNTLQMLETAVKEAELRSRLHIANTNFALAERQAEEEIKRAEIETNRQQRSADTAVRTEQIQFLITQSTAITDTKIKLEIHHSGLVSTVARIQREYEATKSQVHLDYQNFLAENLAYQKSRRKEERSFLGATKDKIFGMSLQDVSHIKDRELEKLEHNYEANVVPLLTNLRQSIASLDGQIRQLANRYTAIEQRRQLLEDSNV